MALFLITGTGKEPAKLEAAIKAKYPTDHFEVTDKVWMVADKVTAKEVAEGLGITDGTTGSALVVSVANYWGRGSTDIWEWMKSRLSATRG